MTQNKKNSFNTCRFDFGIGALLSLAERMTPLQVVEAQMKKMGMRPRKTEADVAALAAAADKRARRAERNRRNAAAQAEGDALAGRIEPWARRGH